MARNRLALSTKTLVWCVCGVMLALIMMIPALARAEEMGVEELTTEKRPSTVQEQPVAPDDGQLGSEDELTAQDELTTQDEQLQMKAEEEAELEEQSAIDTLTNGYAVLRADGSVWRSTITGIPVTSSWTSDARSRVHTLNVADDVTLIPEDVSVGAYSLSFSIAFSGLRTVRFLPDSSGHNACRTISSWAFGYCSNLSEVANLEKTRMTSIGEYAFKGCSLRSVRFPNTLQSINNAAFQECRMLQSVEGLESTQVITVGSHAFADCAMLEKLSFPTATTSIGELAFDGCTSLKSVELPAPSLVNVKLGAFDNTPMVSGNNNNCWIYVPAPLIWDYKEAADEHLNSWSAHVRVLAGTFVDVPTTAWHYNVVRRAALLGIVNGYGNGNFGPNDKVKRGQVAAILWNMAGKPAAGAGARNFPDVKSGAYYYDAVRWASSVGVVSGYGNGRFGPDDNVTREQLAVMLANYSSKVSRRQASGSASDYASMSDASRVSSWARPAVGWCFRNKILSGKGGGRVDPQGNATRAEAAKMVVYLHDMLA